MKVTLEEEIEKIIEKLVKKIMEPKNKPSTPGPGSPHGIYVYRQDGWRMLRREGEPYSIGEQGEGVYIIYFDNTRCPACRIYDPTWFHFSSQNRGEKRHFVIVLCEWFSRNCQSSSASLSFLKYRVKASPTTIFSSFRGGEIIYNNKIEGVVGEDRLTTELAIAEGLFRGGEKIR